MSESQPRPQETTILRMATMGMATALIGVLTWIFTDIHGRLAGGMEEQDIVQGDIKVLQEGQRDLRERLDAAQQELLHLDTRILSVAQELLYQRTQRTWEENE